VKAKFSGPVKGGLMLISALLITSVFLSGCNPQAGPTTASPTLTATPAPEPSTTMPSLAQEYQPPQAEDFSTLPWGQAFDRLHEKFSREYAFTAWKGIDWSALYTRYQPRIARAEADNDRKAYYLALREYVYSIPDGHVGIEGDDLGLLQETAGGGFGIIIARLDDGQVVASWVRDGGPAAAAGIKPGATILEWDGKPIREAIADTSTLLGEIAVTDTRRLYEQLRFLVRAPVGAERTVTFRNEGDAVSTRVSLQATGDNLETITRTDQRPRVALTGWPESIIEQKLLPGNVGYLSIFGEIDLPATLPGDHTPTRELFRKAVDGFIDQGVTGIVIDVRGNAGGSDQMVADFLASFYDTRTLYEYQTWYNALTGKLEQRLLDETTGAYLPGKGLYIEPLAKRFHGPLVALVDNGCVSSGEGVALGIKNLRNGRVVGFYGTNGSFGMSGDAVLMPGGYLIDWPYGQSLDQNQVVQLDSRNGEGGVLPNERVPLTRDNAIRAAGGQDVVLEYALQVLSQMPRSD
jgi:carboxyl-terminal processing protease